jgi:hypothetical protein
MHTRRFPKFRHCATGAALLACGWLAGCGAEVAGAAATAASLSATSAEQARAQQAQIVDQFKALQDTGAARAASAAD